MSIPYSAVCKITGPFKNKDKRYYVKWSYTQHNSIESTILFYNTYTEAKNAIDLCKELIHASKPSSRIKDAKPKSVKLYNPKLESNQPIYIELEDEVPPDEIYLPIPSDRKSNKYIKNKNKQPIGFLENTFLMTLKDKVVIGVCALCGELLSNEETSEECSLVHEKCYKQLGNKKPIIRVFDLSHKNKQKDFPIKLVCDWTDNYKTRHKTAISYNSKNKLIKVVSLMIENNIKYEETNIYSIEWKKVNLKHCRDGYINYVGRNYACRNRY